MTSSLRLTSFGTTLVLVALSGCGSDTKAVKPPPVQPAAQSGTATPPHVDTLARPTLAQFQASLAGSQKQIDATLASLAAVTDPNQANLRGAYDQYCDNLVKLQDQAASLKNEADAMRDSRDAYFSSWEEKTSEIDNPTIRASAEARRKRLRDAHEQIATASSGARDAYVPFVKDLQDIKKYLATDLSKASVADLGDASKKVQASGATVKQKLATLATTLDSIQGGA